MASKLPSGLNATELMLLSPAWRPGCGSFLTNFHVVVSQTKAACAEAEASHRPSGLKASAAETRLEPCISGVICFCAGMFQMAIFPFTLSLASHLWSLLKASASTFPSCERGQAAAIG